MRSLLLAGAFLAFGSTLANAATVSFNFSNPLQLTEISQAGSLGYFDSTLGTLTSVSLTLSGNSSKSITLTNSAAQTQSARAELRSDLFFGSNHSVLNAILSGLNPAISLTNSTSTLTLAPGQSTAIAPLDTSGNRTLSSGAELASIVDSFSIAGGGVFNITCSSVGAVTIVGGGGNVSSSQTGAAACGAAIVYTYTEGAVVDPQNPVPAPAALGLFGVALAGLSVARRRAK